MRSRLLIVGVGVLWTTVAVPALAEVKGVFKGGFDFGGDTLVTVLMSNGDTEKIRANEGMYIGGGVSILNESKTFETELTLNYKFDDITASNGDVSWSVFPVDALFFYRVENWRLGGGATYHLGPKVDGSGFAAAADMDFKNALGFVLQVEYLAAEKFSFGLRIVNLEYEEETTGGTAKANGAGLTASVRF